MTSNKKVVEALSKMDRSTLSDHLTDDVEWVEWADGVPPTGAVQRGKEAFIGNYGDDVLKGTITRLIEEGNTVVAEGNVRVTKKDGSTFHVRYCDIYEMLDGKVKRKSSYGALLKDTP